MAGSPESGLDGRTLRRGKEVRAPGGLEDHRGRERFRNDWLPDFRELDRRAGLGW